MTTRHHTADDGEDIYGTCAEAIAALDAELDRQREACYIEGTWDCDALASMAWSIEVDRATEGPLTWATCPGCDAEGGEQHAPGCQWTGLYEADYVSDWTRQQTPDLADRLVELLQARPELAWEVFDRVAVAGVVGPGGQPGRDGVPRRRRCLALGSRGRCSGLPPGVCVRGGCAPARGGVAPEGCPMTAPRHRYYLEVEIDGVWTRRAGAECSREYGYGYLDGVRDAPTPRLAWRLVRDDDRVLGDVQADPHVGVGQVAGWPTAEQYRAAARMAEQRAATAERLAARRGGR